MVSSDRAWTPGPVDLQWIESVAPAAHRVLLEMEALAEPQAIPIVDRASGRVLAALAVGRPRIVEIGTAIGYSTLWLAIGQGADGRIVTIDPDRDRTRRAREHWRAAGIADERITIVDAPALDAFAAQHADLAGPFDLAFIDALKPEYADYLVALRPRLRPGSLVVADNVLWSGRVSGDRASQPGDRTEDLRRFVAGVMADPLFEATILPVGDGLLVAGFRGQL